MIPILVAYALSGLVMAIVFTIGDDQGWSWLTSYLITVAVVIIMCLVGFQLVIV